MRITANGIRYHADIHIRIKSYPYLVLLHGFMGSGNAFSHLLDRVSKFANPVTIDLLGHGKTEGTGEPDRYTVQRQIDDLYVVLSRLEAGPLFLHGYSMGGRLALRYALAYPATLTGLILESAHSGIENHRAREERIAADEERARALAEDYGSFLDRWSRLPLFNNGITVPRDLQHRYVAMQSRQNPAFMAGSLRGFGAGTMASVRNRLHRLEIPVLLLAGERDEKYVTAQAGMDDLLPDSRFRRMEGAGHRVHLENPDAWIEAVRPFVTNTGTKGTLRGPIGRNES